MRFLHLLPSLLLAGTALAAEKPWSFKDATVSVVAKGSKGTSKESLSPSKPLAQPISLGPAGTLKLSLTTTTTTPSRPHQAFLTLTDPTTGLSTSFALQTRTTGAASLELPYASLPSALLSSPSLSASLVLGSFGSAPASTTTLFNIALSAEEVEAAKQVAKPVRYGKLPEIHHIFGAEPGSPPRVISVFFALAVLATLPVVLGAWALVGGNAGHVGAALSAAPVSHGLFFGSLVAMEGVFAMYYVSWRLFEVLPLAGVVGAVAFVSGSKALSEVQARRVRGER
ncbi:hypothetical protein V495_08189 [Pseudogymnoascus sp. VKM F-4514 (FW-929)]|nr:hypothetical protein V495_08189 [Pseudogymnoascus sp. VKM F-4514 (FW-929)]KFY58333.1 hypothetical protein V497_04883 [Pseudogymnoascus sp. VKM F-4516 (FW-969)]